jgi:hypothetical protein
MPGITKEVPPSPLIGDSFNVGRFNDIEKVDVDIQIRDSWSTHGHPGWSFSQARDFLDVWLLAIECPCGWIVGCIGRGRGRWNDR